jgi:hypothetical protein
VGAGRCDQRKKSKGMAKRKKSSRGDENLKLTLKQERSNYFCRVGKEI